MRDKKKRQIEHICKNMIENEVARVNAYLDRLFTKYVRETEDRLFGASVRFDGSKLRVIIKNRRIRLDDLQTIVLETKTHSLELLISQIKIIDSELSELSEESL